MTEPVTHEHKPNKCLNCDAVLDASSSTDEDTRGPEPGDATICFYCGHLMVFDHELNLRNPNDDELIEMAGDPRLRLVMDACAKARGSLNKRQTN